MDMPTDKTTTKHGECRKCGKCCETLVLFYPFEDIRKMAEKGNPDAKFSVENFTEISREEAFRKNPYFETWTYKIMDDNGFIAGGIDRAHFFTCRRFDSASRICIAYDERPDICKGFPFYDNARLSPFTFYTPTCGYNDVRNYEPEGIALLDKYGIILKEGKSVARELYESRVTESLEEQKLTIRGC